jgi:hypothetical protein
LESSSITRLIFDTIPQIYEAEDGPHRVDIPISGERNSIFSVVPLSDDLKSYIYSTAAIWDELNPMVEGGRLTQIIEREWVQQKFAVAWLEKKTGIVTWNQILDYFRRLSRRTLENRAVSKTLLIEPGQFEDGGASLTDQNFFKVFDWLGSSPLTYYRVDENLRIKGLEAVSVTGVEDLQGYRFYPDLLHPAVSCLKDSKSIIVNLSRDGDLKIADRDGILVTKRVGEPWLIYDKDHLIESMAKVLEQRLPETPKNKDSLCVACSLFQIIFDISMKRQGGLIILDDPKNLSRYIVKGIERDAHSPLNRIFTHSPFNGLEFSIPEARKLVELSSVDGAVILDLHGELVQIGSMVISHPSAVSHFGTREAAAFSAAQFGATALKISADGQASVFFTMPTKTGEQVQRFDLL